MLPTAQRCGMGVLTWSPLNSGWLTGKYRKDAMDLNRFRSEAISHKFDLSLPGNARKAEAVEELIKLADEIGRPLSHVALSFVLSHPAVTSVIIGPRTAEQLMDLIGAADLRLDDDVLDRIDAIVPPGTDLNPADVDYQPPHLASPAQRRLAPADRGA